MSMPARSSKSLIRRVLPALRFESSRHLYWSRYEPRNFGDWIGPYLFRRMTSNAAVHASPSNRSLRAVTMASGSILRRAAGNSVVWGSGIIARDDVFPRPHRVAAVRGPRTHRRFGELGYRCPRIFGDPGILLPMFYRPDPSRTRVRLGLIPHFEDFEEVSERFGDVEGISVIDVTNPVEEVIDDITLCDLAASSSLHGLVVAQSYGVRAGWVRFSDRIEGDGTKYFDYLESAGVRVAGPYRVDAGTSEGGIESFVRDSPQPDLAPLRKPLLESCPFPGSDPGAVPFPGSGFGAGEGASPK